MTKIRKQKKPPKITYKFIDSKDGQESLDQAYNILFEAVLRSQSWKNWKKAHPTK